MKIALGIFKYFPCGGLQTDMKNIALELAAGGNDVTVYTGEWSGEDHPPGIQVKILKLSGVGNHVKALDFAGKFHAASDGADVKIAFNRFGGCDFYFAGDDCYAAALNRRKGAFLLRFLGRYRIFSRLEREIFARGNPTVIFYISPKQKEDYQAVYGTEEERFIYLGPGVEERFTVPESAQRRSCREKLAVREDQTMVLFIAANWKLKGGDRLMESFSVLPEQKKKRTVLHFAGGDSRHEAQALAEKLGISEYCRFHGMQKDILPYLHAADILIHPARKEAAGNVIAEAIACGVPVICSGICGYASLVRECGGGAVLGEPFAQQELSLLWSDMDSRLPEWKKQAVSGANTLNLRGKASDAAAAVSKLQN